MNVDKKLKKIPSLIKYGKDGMYKLDYTLLLIEKKVKSMSKLSAFKYH